MQLVDRKPRARRARLVILGACLTVFFSAFEVLTPLVNFGIFNLTTSKLAAVFFFITVIAWSTGNLRTVLRRRSLDLAVLLFVASNLISVPAAADKAGALKFALRMIYAAGVYFGVSRLPRRFRSHLIIGGTVTAAVLIVAIMGLMENFFIPVTWSWVLGPFQQEHASFGAFYNARIASTLPYPTSLSMYLELTLPVALVFGVWLAERAPTAWRRRGWLAATIAGATAVLVAQLLTFTRTSMVMAPLSLLLGLLLAAFFHYGRRVWMMLAVAVGIFLIALGGSVLFSNKMGARLDLKQQANKYGASYTLNAFPAQLRPGGKASAEISIKNTGTFTWGRRGSDDEVSLFFRWLTYPDGKQQNVPFIITYLPRSVPPGGTVDVKADFNTPSLPGKYVLHFDLAHIHRTWFSAAGVPELKVPVEFTGSAGAPFVIPAPSSNVDVPEPGVVATPRSALWRAAIDIWRSHPVLGIGPDQFRQNYAGYIHVTPDDRIRTHNIFLEALVNTGLIGLLAMIYLLGAAAWVLFRLIRNRQADRSYRLFAIAIMIGLLAYAGHGMLDYFLWQTGISFLFFALLGLAAWMDKTSSWS
ncbi:MAG: O-antigen ligase family protein [Actinobacteria bacterium]|nr:O-antigen ligase family protein [Actinomycetota bacterium]